MTRISKYANNMCNAAKNVAFIGVHLSELSPFFCLPKAQRMLILGYHRPIKKPILDMLCISVAVAFRSCSCAISTYLAELGFRIFVS
jgi:hypothetical protein